MPRDETGLQKVQREVTIEKLEQATRELDHGNYFRAMHAAFGAYRAATNLWEMHYADGTTKSRQNIPVTDVPIPDAYPTGDDNSL